MSGYSRDELHTDRSMHLESEADSPQGERDSLYLDKIESHLAFMEIEFRRNMDWQRKLLSEARRGARGQAQGRNDSVLSLQLRPREEEKLKEVLMDYCALSNDRLPLAQLVRLATGLKGKSRAPERESERVKEIEREKEVSFPLLPRVITLNDLAPSTQHHLGSISPVRLVESRVKVPKYRQAAKSPHQLFSPEREEPVKMGVKYRAEEMRMGREKPSEDSLDKRLQELEGNFMTFRECLADSHKLSENVSLNLSSSPGEASAREKESLLLISDEEDAQQHPSIYLQLKISEQREGQGEGRRGEGRRGEGERRRGEEVLCFSATKKRKIARVGPWIPKNQILEQSKVRLKKLQDSFGKIYHQFEQEKQPHDPIWKPNPSNDRETTGQDD